MEKSKRSEATLTVRMKHEDDYGVNEDSNLSHNARASKKERQSKDDDTHWQQRRETDYEKKKRKLFNAWWFMHWHQLRSHVPQCFSVSPQSLNPKDRERESHPCVDLHQEKQFQHLLSCVRLMSVPCTNNLLAQIFGFRENAQNSSWCWLRIFKISRKIAILKQSLSALLCCVSHIALLAEFTCVMNVTDPTR